MVWSSIAFTLVLVLATANTQVEINATVNNNSSSSSSNNNSSSQGTTPITTTGSPPLNFISGNDTQGNATERSGTDTEGEVTVNNIAPESSHPEHEANATGSEDGHQHGNDTANSFGVKEIQFQIAISGDQGNVTVDDNVTRSPAGLTTDGAGSKNNEDSEEVEGDPLSTVNETNVMSRDTPTTGGILEECPNIQAEVDGNCKNQVNTKCKLSIQECVQKAKCWLIKSANSCQFICETLRYINNSDVGYNTNTNYTIARIATRAKSKGNPLSKSTMYKVNGHRIVYELAHIKPVKGMQTIIAYSRTC